MPNHIVRKALPLFAWSARRLGLWQPGCFSFVLVVHFQINGNRAVRQASKRFPVILVTWGPRQVGKTTLLEACIRLDDFEKRALAQNDPTLFLQMHPPPLLIDEVQYAPALLSAIKIIVDKEKKPGLFWLTGSQKFDLMKGITESLAGRVAILDLLGLSQTEIEDRANTVESFLPTTAWLDRARQKTLTGFYGLLQPERVNY